MTEPTAAAPEITITPRDDGPYRVAGPISLVDAQGNRWDLPEGKTVFLCRCGHSETKPFCDSSHRRVGFQSVVRAPVPDASG